MSSRKRERAAEQKPESDLKKKKELTTDSESVCSNNTETLMACSRNSVTFSEIECNLFKELFRDYTTGIVKLNTNDFMSRTMWIELSRVYSSRARELGLIGRPWTHMILAGHELEARYKICGPHRDTVLTEIFGTSKIIPVFPTSLISEISFNPALESRTGSILNCNKSTGIDVEGFKPVHNSAGEPFVGRGVLQSVKQLLDLCVNMERSNLLTQDQLITAIPIIDEWVSGQRYCSISYLLLPSEPLQEKADFLIKEIERLRRD